jgi:hypothetical protein
MEEQTITTTEPSCPIPNGADQDVLRGTFTKKPTESKKWVGMALGVICVLFVWATTVVCMFIKTPIANEFVSIATIVISFIGAMVTTLITGQAAMEWKAASSLTEMNSGGGTTTTTTNVNKNIVEDASKPKPFATAATQ